MLTHQQKAACLPKNCCFTFVIDVSHSTPTPTLGSLSVRPPQEEMSELRGAIRLTEKEKRCLEWTLMAQRAQDEAGALLLDSLKEELEERSLEQQVDQEIQCSTHRQYT